MIAFVWHVVKRQGGVVDDLAQRKFAPGVLGVYEIVEPLLSV